MRWLSGTVAKLGKFTVVANLKGITQVCFSNRLELIDSSILKASKNSSQYDVLRECLDQLELYADNKLKAFDLPLDISGSSQFRQKVWKACIKIKFGQTLSYGELAEKISQPSAARAVGQAMGHNPIPIIIPCHRVLASGQKMGGFSAGLENKSVLLGLEGIVTL